MLKFYVIIIQLIAIVLSNNASWITYANYSYLIAQDEVNHTAASSRCSEVNSQLVVVYNESVQDFLENEINEKFSSKLCAYWIGLYDNSSDKTNRFINKTRTYENWVIDGNSKKEQHLTQEYCVSMGLPQNPPRSNCNLKWYSIPCSGRSDSHSGFILPSYICQKELYPKETSSYTQSYPHTTSSYESTNNNKSNSVTFVAIVISLVVLIVLILFLFVGFNCWKDIKLEKKLRRKEAKANVIHSLRAEEPKESTKTFPEKGNYVLAKDVGNTFNEEPNNEEESSQNNSSEVENNVDATKLE